MKIYETVQTKERAEELIKNYVNENNLHNGHFENKSCRCECGETQLLRWTNFDVYADVAICSSCGGDDIFNALTIS